mgnify:CR=1 FL=1
MNKHVPAKREELAPFRFLQTSINDLFNDFWSNGNAAALTEFSPQADITETDKEITVKVDLAGVEEKDVAVEFDQGILTIRGEKNVEREEKNKTYHLTERNSGSFLRAFSMPATVDGQKVTATYDNGELTVALPKNTTAAETKRKIIVNGKSAKK